MNPKVEVLIEAIIELEEEIEWLKDADYNRDTMGLIESTQRRYKRAGLRTAITVLNKLRKKYNEG